MKLKGGKHMPEWLWLILIIGAYFAMMKWVLPFMGVST
jgi:hypothetical protein